MAPNKRKEATKLLLNPGQLPFIFLTEHSGEREFDAIPFPGLRFDLTLDIDSPFFGDKHHPVRNIIVGHAARYMTTWEGVFTPVALEIATFADVGEVIPRESEGALLVNDILLRHRVRVKSVRRSRGEFVADWIPVIEELPSEADFSSSEFQNKVLMIQLLAANFSKLMGRLSTPLPPFTRLTAGTIGFYVDRISNLLFRKLVTIPEIKIGLERILIELNVGRRLELLINLLKETTNHSETITKSILEGSTGFQGQSIVKKEDFPEAVWQEIEHLRQYADPKSETGRTHTLYIEWLLGLPWKKTTEDEKDFSVVRDRLSKDHYGLEHVTDRILEYLAVRRLKPDAKAPILCFVGPAGVGKTSLGQSIANAMGRKFVLRSLSGIKDEAQIRGHRRTYIGALPGIIIEGLRGAGSRNPVFMLDEIDKLGEHGRDIPSHALLEVLDPEQNHAFRDNYIGLPFDLSQVLFITTANTIHNIHPTLLNRLAVIELPGYSEEEKIEIAERHLIPKALKNYGITPEDLGRAGLPLFTVKFSREVLQIIVSKYVNDAGVRDTERMIKRVMEKVLKEIWEGRVPEPQPDASEAIIEINSRDGLRRYLDDPKIHEWMPDLGSLPPGVAVVLTVDSNGLGAIDFMEVSCREDTRLDRKSTGSLSLVLQESIEVAFSRLLHKGGALEGLSHKKFFHFHMPDGAIPKDGPSAGVQIPTALLSFLLGASIKPFFAATGEITLRRDIILPVGGIRAKLLAAERGGIKEVAIPLANLRDLEKLPPRIRNNMDIIMIPSQSGSPQDISRQPKERFTVYCVNKIEDVLALALPDHFPLTEERLRTIIGNSERSS